MADEGLSPPLDEYPLPRAENKRKFGDADRVGRPGFSAESENRVSYNSVPPPISDFELAKQRAQQIAARLVAQDANRSEQNNLLASTKRTRTVESLDENTSYNNAQSDQRGHQVHLGQKFQDQSRAFRQQDEATDLEQPRYRSFQGPFQTQRIDVANSKVGLIIGKGGETIKYLQHQSGAKIQVTRDAESDPNAPSRQVELTGFPDQISRAEQLIMDVIVQADGGGGQGGFGVQGANAGEQLQVRVPNNKVGLIIGRGGETIRSLQSRSGAHIQLSLLQPAENEPGSTERMVIIMGTKKQTDAANEMIKEIISENRMRGPPKPGGYSQHGYRPSGPPMQWGAAPGGPLPQQPVYGYQQQPRYPGPPQQYPGPPHGGYSQQPPSDYNSGWDQQPLAPQQPQNYYNQQGQPGAAVSDGYNQPPGGGYNQQLSYGQQGYGQQGYAQQGSESQLPVQPGYGHQGYSQQGYAVGSSQQGYGNVSSGYNQQNYGQPGAPYPSYGQEGASQYEEQGSTQLDYEQQGSAHEDHGEHGSAQASYVRSGPSYSQQSDGPQRTVQQGSTLQGYGQGSAQHGHVQQGSMQTFQPGSKQDRLQEYGQQENVQPVYGQQGAGQQGEENQGSAQTGYGKQAPSMQQDYGQQGSVMQGYGQQRPVQQGYAQQTFVPRQGQQQNLGNRPGYGQPLHDQPGYSQQSPYHPLNEATSGGGGNKSSLTALDMQSHGGAAQDNEI